MLKVQSYGEHFTVISNNKYTKHMLNILQPSLAFCLLHFSGQILPFGTSKGKHLFFHHETNKNMLSIVCV